ncbi:MAG: DUF2065 domain-containing protein [Pseudomonadota bacterium]|nr:DUF2065 domain-containing protein [Pseudomonadota bacterium]
MPEAFLAACALVLVLEGILPLIAPRVWRDAFRRLTDLSDGQLRFIGLISIGVGVITLMVIRA